MATATATATAQVQIDPIPFRDRVLREVAQRLDFTAQFIAERARAYAPVDTGELQASIAHRTDYASLIAYVYVGVPYGIFAEFSTRFWAGQPFLRPALADAAALWGGGGFQVSVHAASVVSRAHGEVTGRRHGGMREVEIAGTSNPRSINRKQIKIRKARNKELNRKLVGVKHVYHGQRQAARTAAIPRGALPFRSTAGPSGITWLPD